jgi:hypothetical protein
MSLFKSKKIVIATIAVFSIVGLIWFALAHSPVIGSVDTRWADQIKNSHTIGAPC